MSLNSLTSVAEPPLDTMEQTDSKPDSKRHLPKPLLWASVTTLVCTLLSWLYALVNAMRGRSYPYNWPYLYLQALPGAPHHGLYSDLLLFQTRFHFFHTSQFFNSDLGIVFPYPATTSIAYRCFLPTFAHPEIAFLVCMSLFIAGAAVICAKRLMANGLSQTAAVSFSILFVLLSEVFEFEARQANAEFFVFVVLSCALFLYVNRRYQSSAVLVGIAISMKIYPFILLGFFFSSKRYKEIATALVTVLVCTLAACWIETGNIALSFNGSAAGLQYFANTYALKIDSAVGWDHSIFGLLKRVTRGDVDIPALSRIYMSVAAVGSLVLYFARIRRMPLFNQIACLVVISILIPPVSFEYTLMHLYSVFALFACLMVRRREFAASRAARWMGICFGLLFSVQGYLILQSRVVEGQVKCLVLLVLLGLCLVYPMADETLDAVPA